MKAGLNTTSHVTTLNDVSYNGNHVLNKRVQERHIFGLGLHSAKDSLQSPRLPTEVRTQGDTDLVALRSHPWDLVDRSRGVAQAADMSAFNLFVVRLRANSVFPGQALSPSACLRT